MAIKSSSISLFLLFNIFLAMAGHGEASRVGPTIQKEEDKKQPEWFIEPDGSVLIPGIGRILVPMPGHVHGSYGSSPSSPSYGGGSSGSSSPVGSGEGGQGGQGGSSSGSHIPGGDDTLVPNPGYEVPTPSAP